MTLLILDGSKMQTFDAFHDQMLRNPETPRFCGRNLNAVYDVLTGFFEPPVTVKWYNVGAAKESFGDFLPEVLRVFTDAEKEWSKEGEEFRLELFEGPPPMDGAQQ